MNRGLFLSLFLLFSSLSSRAYDDISKIEELKLWENPHWHAILHYRKNLTGGYTSEADSPNFFFHPKGKNSPKEELIANYQEFTKTSVHSDENKNSWCRFPTRARFFEKYVKGFHRPIVLCPELQSFRERVSAKSLSLVFSSYYLDTPASAFGHTLLRMRKSNDQKESERYELLDYAANYAANVTTTNAFLYGVLGLTGGFKGEYAIMPYFYKIREYNDFESRDIWDYELNLSQEQIDWVIDHLWEMRQTFFYYYYFSENCSYHMMALLDVANPSFKLAERTPYFVIPIDTVKVLMETEGLVKDVLFRPSSRRTLKARLKELSSNEQEVIAKLMSTKDTKLIPNETSLDRKVAILDTAIDFIDYLHAEDIVAERAEPMAWKNQFLIERAKTGVKTSPLVLPYPTDEQPHLGHGSGRLSLGNGYNDQRGAFHTIEYRASLHDFIDPRIGQNPDATMEMGKFRLRYDHKGENQDKGKFVFDHITVANVVSMSPIVPFFSKATWRFFVGAKRLHEDICDYCLVPRIEIAGGAAQRFGDFFYLFLFGTDIDAHKDFGGRAYRLGLGPELTLNWKIAKNLIWQVSGEYKRHYFIRNKDAYNYGTDITYHITNNFGLGINARKYEASKETALSIQTYF